MIYTIFTGGTIGSSMKGDTSVSVSEAAAPGLIERYQSIGEPQTDFKTVAPISILSENLEAQHLLTIISEVRTGLTQPDIDGIIITHGTDTLQYTAAILSYIFADVSVPIIMVSSNYILEDDRANGFINFYFAVRFIEEGLGRGVFVSYCNDGELPTIHRGNRLGNPVVFSDYVYSVRGQFYGQYECDTDDMSSWPAASYKPCSKYRIDPENTRKLFFDEQIRISTVSSGILKVNAAPGMVYPGIPEYTRAILLNSYHSGTICLDSRMNIFLEEAHGRDVPVFLLGLAQDATQYETMKAYDEYGIIPLYDCAPISQYCKLWLLMSNDIDISDGMMRCYCEER